MYLLFREHHILPSVYCDMKPGERVVLRAFTRYEMDERKKELDSLKGGF
jgi:hypothetical protein